ncbi:MAG TPA: hypothetical protein VG713_12360, partial [Pirellulales bacterium]|nr:hypothetical protein [Pirellulales bacterium]
MSSFEASTDAAIPATRLVPAAAGLFAGAVFVSAFLLFEVQPLISKFILPWFGGTPGVWTTCMLFFQVLLFAGYAYAHLSERFLTATAQARVHLALLVAALALLPITPDASWKPAGDADPTGRILALLAASVGFPYFVLSSTGPLLQAWFVRRFPNRSPYRLYSLSNVGSLTALVSYPFVVEPALSAPEQASAWSGAFVAFALLCGGCAACVWRMRLTVASFSESRESGSERSAPGALWVRRALWLGLPACASLTLLATTNYVCQDVAVIPFLWIAPLSLYLLSFIVAFDHSRWYLRRPFGLATMLLWLAVAGVSPAMHWLE